MIYTVDIYNTYHDCVGMARRPRNIALCEAFGDRLRMVRSEAGLSQEELAHVADLDRSYVGHIERGAINPTLDTIMRLAAAVDEDPGVLVNGLLGTSSSR